MRAGSSGGSWLTCSPRCGFLMSKLKMALKIALVLCYSRPFIELHEYAEVNIVDSLLNDYLDEEIVIHRNILEMRKKDIGGSDLKVDDKNGIESNIIHISMHGHDSVPLEYAIVESIKKMADKINSAADKIASDKLGIDIAKQPANEV